MAKHSRNKGNAFERKVAKLIADACGLSAKDCYRTPLSGGHQFAGAADLRFSKRLIRIAPFCVECKHYKTFKLHQMLTPTALIRSWHRQVLRAVKRTKRQWMPVLFIRGNGGPIYASAPWSAWLEWDKTKRLADTCNGLHYRCAKMDWKMVSADVLAQVLQQRTQGDAT